MAVTVVGTPVSTSAIQAVASVSITVPVGATLLMAFLGMGYGEEALGTVQRDGSNMTLLDEQASPDNRCFLKVFYTLNPPSGTYNLTHPSISNGHVVLGGICFSGSKSSAPFNVLDKNGGSEPGGTSSPTSATGELCVDGFVVRSDISNIIADGGQTEQLEVQTSGSPASLNGRLGVSTEAGASSVTMGWTYTTSGDGLDRWAHLAVSIQPEGVAAVAEPAIAALTFGRYFRKKKPTGLLAGIDTAQEPDEGVAPPAGGSNMALNSNLYNAPWTD